MSLKREPEEMQFPSKIDEANQIDIIHFYNTLNTQNQHDILLVTYANATKHECNNFNSIE